MVRVVAMETRATNGVVTMCGRAFSPWLRQGALQDQGNMRNALGANVAEKLADIWLATHLRGNQKKDGRRQKSGQV